MVQIKKAETNHMTFGKLNKIFMFYKVFNNFWQIKLDAYGWNEERLNKSHLKKKVLNDFGQIKLYVYGSNEERWNKSLFKEKV